MLFVRGRLGIVATVLVAGMLLIGLAGCARSARPAISIPAPMRATQFWKVIDAARGTSDPTARSASPSALKNQLKSFSVSRLASFDVRYDDIMDQLDRWSVWDAGYAAAQGMGDDDFDYFRDWLIGKGQIVVRQAESDPEGLVRYLTPVDVSKDGFENELLGYVAGDLLAKRRGEVAADAFDDKISADVDNDPVGEETKENGIDAQYPLLAAWAAQHDH
jgi:hypothetical protein